MSARVGPLSRVETVGGLMAVEQGGATQHTDTAAASLELHLSRSVFATGRHLSGVVVFRVSKPTSIRALTVTIDGRESPIGRSLTRTLRGTSSFFDREALLSGMEEPRFTSERVSQLWNAFLRRDTPRILSPGEHMYPFSLALPASLPPSYSGRAGRIAYTVTARVRYPVGRSLRVSQDVSVAFVPRAHRGRPIALSYPSAGGTVHAGEVNVSLELSRRSVELGNKLRGTFSISNPKQVDITEITVSLEICEWVRLTSDKELHRQMADSRCIRPTDPTAKLIEADFELTVPRDASPTVEGTAISVIWLLKLSINTAPPLELKTPIAVFAGAEQ